MSAEQSTQIPSATSATSELSPEGQKALEEYMRRTGGSGVFIERPLAPARPGGKIVDDPSYGTFVPDTVTRTSPEAGASSRVTDRYRSGFVRLNNPTQSAVNKYHSIHSLEESKKISALKDPSLNPNLIEDGYDQLAHNLHIWTIVGQKAKAAGNISFDEQTKIASKFYDTMIAPAYGHIYKDSGSAEPLSKDVWMKQAFGEALNYKIEDAYTNDWYHSLKHGWDSGLAATARAADRVTTMAGNVFNAAVAQWRKDLLYNKATDAERRAAYQGHPSDYWIHRMQDINHQLDESKKEYNENIIQRGARWQSQHREFWADVLPAHDGFMNHATSFVAEQAAQAPIFAALELGTEPLAATGLTGALSKTPAGRRMVGYLTAGAEGLAYGAATRKQNDPGEAWRDAVGFAVFHGMFDVAGAGLKKIMDVVPKDSKLGEALEKRNNILNLAQEGKRPATPVEVYDDHKTETANNIFATGITGQRAIHVDALHHISEMETVGDKAQIRTLESKFLASDPARYAPVLSAARFIRTLLGDKRLSDVQPGSEEEKYLSFRLAQLIVDSASEMNSRVQNIGEIAQAKAPQLLTKSGAQHTLEFYVQKVQQQLAGSPGAVQMVTKEQVQKAAAKMYAEDLQNAAEDAEKELEAPKTEKAQNVTKRIKADKPIESVAALRVRSSRTVNKYGEPSASYNIVPEYKARLQVHKDAAKAVKQNLTQYFEDLSDTDFENDLTQYFYPESLRKAGVFFEGQNTREGMQNPNFLAFMYNYLPQMPKEFGQELENRLADTLKVQKYMNGKTPTDPQLMYYAKSMYNHVDNFLGSGRWPTESNLFRSSNENMFKTTQWQRQLLVEKTMQEQKNLKDAFSGNKKALTLALKTHAAFSKLRMAEFDKATPKRGSQDIIKAYDHVIADLQTKSGDYDRWVF